MKKLLIAVISFILALIAIFFLGIIIFVFEGTGFMQPLIIAAVIVLLFILVAAIL